MTSHTDLDFFSANAVVQQAATLEIPELELMYKLECSGEAFYMALADRIGNDEAADLLRKNAVEEKAHARRIAKAISLKSGIEWEPTGAIANVFDAPLPEQVTVKMLQAFIAGEAQADAGYQAWADKEPNEEVAKLYRLNGREELLHAERVQKIIEILER